MSKRKILVTSALPYANGEIHLGHLLEYIQTDIWVRYQKMMGNECHYVCADDAHGTPIMLKADELGIDPEKLIASVSERHQADFNDFAINFSQYHSTHSEENREVSEGIYHKLNDGGFIKKRVISQAFDPEKRCSYRTDLLKVIALSVEPQISMAITANHVEQLTQLQSLKTLNL